MHPSILHTDKKDYAAILKNQISTKITKGRIGGNYFPMSCVGTN